MAETQQNQPAQSPTPPATGGARAETRKATATPAVFGDGSTREQQQEQIKAAEETNKLIKAAGDAEREARSG